MNDVHLELLGLCGLSRQSALQLCNLLFVDAFFCWGRSLKERSYSYSDHILHLERAQVHAAILVRNKKITICTFLDIKLDINNLFNHHHQSSNIPPVHFNINYITLLINTLPPFPFNLILYYFTYSTPAFIHFIYIHVCLIYSTFFMYFYLYLSLCLSANLSCM